MSDPDKLTREEIADFRAHHRYREDLRRKNREAIQEEIRISQMPRSEAREKLGLAIVDLGELTAADEPPPWYIDDNGGIVIDLMDSPPLFRTAVNEHNRKLRNPWANGNWS